ncbi:MAG: thioesterase family protein [Acidobacteriota bacterium]|nr:thioesterase family protein [Acidobacteriota bacterium]
MPDLPIGTRGEERRRVTPEIAIDFLGLPGARVLGTPFMIMMMEITCRNSVLSLLGKGYDTVGTEVCIRHLAATPLGMEVTYRSELIAAEDRRLRFKVEAFDDKEKVGEGTHERGIINVAKFAARLEGKLKG